MLVDPSEHRPPDVRAQRRQVQDEPSDRPGTFNPDDGYTKWDFENQVKLFVGHLQHEQEKYNRAVNYKGYGINGRYVAPMISEETLGKRR